MKRLVSVILCTFVFFALTVCAFADCGPKPSLTVSFKNGGDEHFYAALISEESSLMPMWIKAQPTAEDYALAEKDPGAAAYIKFAEYSDGDGFVFFGVTMDSSESHSLRKGYYPPDVFKVLVWYPDSDTIVSTGTYNCYAFSSYFTVDLDNINGWDIKAEPSYEYLREGVSLLLRIVLTIAVELLAALAFGIREKKALMFLAAVNAGTQILLNAVLSVVTFSLGFTGFLIFFIPAEIMVFTAEQLIYSFNLRKYTAKCRSTWKIFAYTMTANTASMVIGFFIQLLAETAAV